MLRLAALLLTLSVALAPAAQAQQPRRGGACTGPSALVLQPFAITPEGAIYSFNIQPRQTVVIVLGVSLSRIPDEALQRAMRLTCHS
jgi:hypothetical protein